MTLEDYGDNEADVQAVAVKQTMEKATGRTSLIKKREVESRRIIFLREKTLPLLLISAGMVQYIIICRKQLTRCVLIEVLILLPMAAPKKAHQAEQKATATPKHSALISLAG